MKHQHWRDEEIISNKKIIKLKCFSWWKIFLIMLTVFIKIILKIWDEISNRLKKLRLDKKCSCVKKLLAGFVEKLQNVLNFIWMKTITFMLDYDKSMNMLIFF